MSGYEGYFRRFLPMVEEYMRGVLTPPVEVLAPHYGMMEYHLGWKNKVFQPVHEYAGKRVRPLLLLLATEAVSGSVEGALPAAAAVELLHNFSLIHDDIEDRSPTRRGRPSVWQVWGIAQAINVGDAMFAVAYRTLEGLRDWHPAERVLTAISLFSEATLRLTEGQYLDMTFEQKLDVSVDEYVMMIERKTAALLAVSTGLGALLGGAPESVWKSYWSFGRYVGLTFQIVDDILGIWGDEKTLGKSVSSDILTKKKTYPVVYGLTSSPIRDSLRDLYAGPPFTESDVPRVVELLEMGGAREAAWDLAHRFHDRAIAALESVTPSTEAKEALVHFANSLLSRKR